MNKHTPKYHKWNFWCWLKRKHDWNYVTTHKRECTRCHTYEVEIYNRRLDRIYTWIDATLKDKQPIMDNEPYKYDSIVDGKRTAIDGEIRPKIIDRITPVGKPIRDEQFTHA